MTHAYDDIIGLPHHTSPVRKPMSMHDRAAQFAPFAALTGYEDEVTEAGRLTAGRIQPEEHDLELLDRELAALRALLEKDPSRRPQVRLIRFCPDARKDGGSYEPFEGRLRRIDSVNRKLVFEDRTEVELDRIIRLEPERTVRKEPDEKQTEKED